MDDSNEECKAHAFCDKHQLILMPLFRHIFYIRLICNIFQCSLFDSFLQQLHFPCNLLSAFLSSLYIQKFDQLIKELLLSILFDQAYLFRPNLFLGACKDVYLALLHHKQQNARHAHQRRNEEQH